MTTDLENALIAVGCPEERCPECGTHARPLARLTMEVLPDVLDHPSSLPEDNVRSLGERLTEDRGRRYGHPKDNWRRIGIKWQADLDLPEPIPPHIVGIMMLDVKTSRMVETPDDPDSLDDIEGYVEAQRMLFRP
jgi:hypothetical protein